MNRLLQSSCWKVPCFVGSAIAVCTGAIVASLAPNPASAHGPGAVRRIQVVSVSDRGGTGNNPSGDPSISATGRFVAFASWASDLVAADTNGTWDVFVRDRRAGTTRRVSVASGGGQADGPSAQPAISPDGRYIAFVSSATNLVPDDTNDADDVFVHDRRTGRTQRVSVSGHGAQAEGWGSFSPSISAHGRYVAFASWASNLVPQDRNGSVDVFLHDRRGGGTVRASVSSTEAEASGFSGEPAITPDGRYVAFDSYAPDLVSNDADGERDVFVRDLRRGFTTLVSLSSAGKQPNSWGTGFPAISANGRYVAFISNASNLVAGDDNLTLDVFVRDRRARTTSRISVSSGGQEADQSSWNPVMSADGRFVAYSSFASTLVPGDTNASEDVFVHDRRSGTTRLVSSTVRGALADEYSNVPTISGNGRSIAFTSFATNLAAGDRNGDTDVFVRGPAR